MITQDSNSLWQKIYYSDSILICKNTVWIRPSNMNIGFAHPSYMAYSQIVLTINWLFLTVNILTLNVCTPGEPERWWRERLWKWHWARDRTTSPSSGTRTESTTWPRSLIFKNWETKWAHLFSTIFQHGIMVLCLNNIQTYT